MKRISLKTMMVLVLGGMVFASQIPARAQFGGLGIGKKKSDDAGGAPVDKKAFGKASDEVLGKVLTARIAFLESQVWMMDALGLKTDAVAKASEALQAVKGSSEAEKKVDALKDSSKASTEANEKFEAAMAESKELSAESKAKFAKGGAKFIEGILLEKEQIETIQKLVEQGQSLVKSAGPLEKPGVMSLVKPVTTMSSMVPGDVKEGSSALSKILKFAKSQKVAIPGADKATKSLGELDDKK